MRPSYPNSRACLHGNSGSLPISSMTADISLQGYESLTQSSQPKSQHPEPLPKFLCCFFWWYIVLQALTLAPGWLSRTIHSAAFSNLPAHPFPGPITLKPTRSGRNSTSSWPFSQAADRSWASAGNPASTRSQAILGDKGITLDTGNGFWWMRRYELYKEGQKACSISTDSTGQGENTATRIKSRKCKSRQLLSRTSPVVQWLRLHAP